MNVFGKPINRNLIAYENDIAINISSLSGATLYSSLGDAVDQLNPIGSMSSWVANGTVINYNLPEVSDPNPSSDRTTWQLWERITYKLTEGGNVQTDYRAIDISRAVTADSYPGTTKTDLKGLFPALSAYLSDARIDDILDLANLQMRLDIKASKVEYSKVKDLQETKLALAYLAIAMSAESQFTKTGQDAHMERAKLYRQMYTDTLAKVTLPYDSDGDSVADQVIQPNASTWFVPR